MADDTKRILRLHTNIARLMTDDRFLDGREHGLELRSFVMSWWWSGFELPAGEQDARWERCLALMGRRLDEAYWWVQSLWRADRPRFDPDHGRPERWARVRCCVPLVRGPRKGDLCGQAWASQVRVTEPVSGEWRVVGYCRRHAAEGAAARAKAEPATGVAREPVPNVGGLLPCYVRASNWPDLYAGAQPGWKPPELGINADDWPTLAKVVRSAPRLVGLDGDGDGEDDGGVLVWSGRSLRLVT